MDLLVRGVEPEDRHVAVLPARGRPHTHGVVGRRRRRAWRAHDGLAHRRARPQLAVVRARRLRAPRRRRSRSARSRSTARSTTSWCPRSATGGPDAAIAILQHGRGVDGHADGARPDHHHGRRPARDGAVLAADRADASCATSRARSRSACSSRPSRTRCSPCARCGSRTAARCRGSRSSSPTCSSSISIVVLVLYVHHIGRSLRVSTLIELVGTDTRALLDRAFPDHGPPSSRAAAAHRAPTTPASSSTSTTSGSCESRATPDCTLVLQAGARRLRAGRRTAVRRRGRRERRSPATTCAERRGAGARARRSTRTSPTACGCSSTSRSARSPTRRSSTRRPPCRPSTACTTACASSRAGRSPDGAHRDDDGRVRLIVPVMDWDAYVHLAFDEIRLAGAGSPQVTRRLVSALEDLRAVALPDRVAGPRPAARAPRQRRARG